MRPCWMAAVLLLVSIPSAFAQSLKLGFEKTAQFDEQVRWTRLKSGVRAEIPADAPNVRLAFPERPADAANGSQFLRQIAGLPRDQREATILRELRSGNIPESLRRLKPIRVSATDDSGIKHTATYFVMADYLAIGTDEDFFRVPITPATASSIADKFEASLITVKVSDDLFAAAHVKLDPKPLTKDRDAVVTFWQHHQIIEEQHG